MEDRPWLAQYDPGVPISLQPYPERTLLDDMAEIVRQRPDHPALRFKGSTLSYGEIDRLGDAFAAGLGAHGVARGDRVALLLPNSPQAIIGQIGAWKAGAIAVPINPLYTGRELKNALAESGANTALVLTPFYDKVKAVQGGTELKTVLATNIKEYLPPALRLLFTLLKERRGGHRVTLEPGDRWLDDLLREHAGAPRPTVPVEPGDPAVILFSGGTTGTPKGAIATHHTLLMSGMQVNAWFRGVKKDWEDVLTLFMPLFHVYGNVGVVPACILGRGSLAVVPNPRDLDDLLSVIRKTRPAFLPGVPTLFIALLAHPAVRSGRVDLRSVKLCLSGAAPLLTDTKERFERVTGGRVVEGYALTESMMAAAINPLRGEYRPGSAGLPLPDVNVRIADPDTGSGTLPPGDVGEILMSAPNLMKEYWRRPEETARAIRDGWLYTGDLGTMDEDGFLYIVDRKKDVIKPSGFQVWPREVEEVIASHPAVAEVGVAGVPDEYQGESVKAWIVLREDAAATAGEITDHCRESLAAYKVPRQVEFRESLPRSAIGKVLRRKLARE